MIENIELVVWWASAVSAIFGAVSAVWYTLHKLNKTRESWKDENILSYYEENKARIDRLEVTSETSCKALRVILKAQLIQEAQKYLDRGYVTFEEFEDFEEDYQIYSGPELKGNGMAHKAYTELSKLRSTQNEH